MFPLFVVSTAMQGQAFTLVGETERNAMQGQAFTSGNSMANGAFLDVIVCVDTN